MSDEEAPSWLNESPPQQPISPPIQSTRQKQQISQDSQVSNQSSTEPKWKPLIRIILFCFNSGFMIMMAACGALGVSSANNVNDAGVVFVGIYMILFASILFIYEVAQLAPNKFFCSSVDLLIKKNFGFLYGTIGKCCYLLFMGILAFGLSTPRKLSLATGILVALWAILQGLLYLKWPDHFDKKEKFIP